jgi:hypothetical protein
LRQPLSAAQRGAAFAGSGGHNSSKRRSDMLKTALVLASTILMLTAGAAFAGTPFGGDDTGFLPPGGTKGTAYKCEFKISVATQNLVKCIQKCHDSRAKLKFADDTAEDACESANDGKSCFAKYFKVVTAAIGKGGCPACAIANSQTIPGLAESVLDAQNGMVWCASPSGAFVDGLTNY